MQSDMQMSKTSYSTTAIILHWLTAICVILAIPMAIGMNNLPEGPLQDSLFNYHKSFGQLIWFIAVLRIVNRWVSGAPAPVSTLTSFELLASKIVHVLLYVLIFVVPVVGYLGTAAYPAPLTFFAWELPNLVPEAMRGEKTSGFFLETHQFLGITLAVVVCLHIAAALFHAVVKKDGVMARMTSTKQG